ncbi:MAG: carbonic anhydrase [Planctomycetota bacterium]|nr:carbonic anhydrase [Planctomycetota bacterium]MDP6837814.1 carbonic anhydrase [Planctomycetota bacterium]
MRVDWAGGDSYAGPMESMENALERLRAGNRRYAEGAPLRATVVDPARRRELAAGQAPFAVILGCSDSRVPAEIVFDCGLGELFVVRVAGNIAAPSQVASVEYAVKHLGTKLVVVLGHSGCGAVTAALDEVLNESSADGAGPVTGGSGSDSNLASVLARIRPAVEGLVRTQADTAHDREDLLGRAVKANTKATARELLSTSGLLAAYSQAGELLVVQAEYDLSSGLVSFL